MPKVSFAPGIVSEGTDLQVGAGWVDGNLMRFRNGHPSPIGGWVQLGSGSISGVCRSMHEWSNLTGSVLLGMGTNQKAYILCADTFYDITPDGFIAGSPDALVATGWGVGAYSAGTYGTPRVPLTDALSEIVTQPLIWHLDNFGQDLILNPRGGHLYIWHAVGGFGRKATLLSADPSASEVPEFASGVMVNPQYETVVAFGCSPLGGRTPDPMIVRWTDLRNPYNWKPSSSNSAGDYRIPLGSFIVGHLPTYYETLIWTDKGVYVMQFLNSNSVYGFQPVAKGISMISPQAAIGNGSIVAWMDRGCFYQYSGSVAELPCPLKKEVFDGLNIVQGWKVHAAHNHSFSEISWFYPTGNEIDSYVTWNYRENVWTKGKLARTAWSDSGRLSTPVAVDPSGNVMFHEQGTDANGAPMPYSLTSGDLVINEGETFLLLQKLIPDFRFQESLGQNQQTYIDIMTRDSSSAPRRIVKTLSVSPNNSNRGAFDPKVRGRRVSIRIRNDEQTTGTSWIMGQLQAGFIPNGKR